MPTSNTNDGNTPSTNEPKKRGRPKGSKNKKATARHAKSKSTLNTPRKTTEQTLPKSAPTAAVDSRHQEIFVGSAPTSDPFDAPLNGPQPIEVPDAPTEQPESAEPRPEHVQFAGFAVLLLGMATSRFFPNDPLTPDETSALESSALPLVQRYLPTGPQADWLLWAQFFGVAAAIYAPRIMAIGDEPLKTAPADPVSPLRPGEPKPPPENSPIPIDKDGNWVRSPGFDI